MSPYHRRRKTDRGILGLLIWAYYQLVPVIAIFLAAYAVHGLGDTVKRNSQAIRVSCLLLVDPIIQTGGVRAPKGYPITPEARAQTEITKRLIQIIGRQATPKDIAYIAPRERVLMRRGGPLRLPNCADVAKNPERYEERLKARAATRQREK